MNQLNELPDTTGTYIVETEHSVYIVDIDAKTFQRNNDLGNNPIALIDNQDVSYTEIFCQLGKPMEIHRSDGLHLWSTRVISIFADEVDE